MFSLTKKIYCGMRQDKYKHCYVELNRYAEFEYANIPPDQTWVDPNETPTHISAVFSSSALSDTYEGAIARILVVDDFKLIYN